jgi:hypothetical protein
MWPFKKKDKNKLNNHFISDILIGYTLNLMGKSDEDVINYFEGIKIGSKTDDKGITRFMGILSNGCVFLVLLENKKVFKINIWLNNKPSKGDSENLNFFQLTHEAEYYLYSLFDNRVKGANKNMIAFESKIF